MYLLTIRGLNRQCIIFRGNDAIVSFSKIINHNLLKKKDRQKVLFPKRIFRFGLQCNEEYFCFYPFTNLSNLLNHSMFISALDNSLQVKIIKIVTLLRAMMFNQMNSLWKIHKREISMSDIANLYNPGIT